MKNQEIFQNFFSGKTVFVTGHTGFIGAWTSLWLLYLGSNVVGYSKDIPTKPSLFEILKIKNDLTHVTGDVNNLKKLKSTIEQYKPSIVFHLAAQPLVRTSYEKPIETFQTNIIGTANILESIRNIRSVKSCILFTTDKVYRNLNNNNSFKETDILGGVDPYSSSKSSAELVISSYKDSFFSNTQNRLNVGIASIRSGNVIGGGDWGKERIIPDSINSIIKNKKIHVRNPLHVRPFQFVLEPVAGMLKLAEKLTKEPEKFSSSWNMGPNYSNKKITVKKLVELLIKHWGDGVWIDASRKTSNPLPESKSLILNSTKSKKILNWHSIMTFEEAITFTVDWYKAFFEKKSNMRDFSLYQIKKYSQKLKQSK